MLKYGEVSVRCLSCRDHGAVPYDTLYTNIRRRASAAAPADFPYFQVSCSKRAKSPLPSLSGNGRAAAGGADAGVVSATKRTGRQRREPLPAHTKVRSLSVPMKEAPAGASFFTLPAGQCCPVRWRSRAPPLCTAPALPAAWSPCPGVSPSAWRPSPPDGSVPGSVRCP